MNETRPGFIPPNELAMMRDEPANDSPDKKLNREHEKKLADYDLAVIKSMQTKWGAIMAGPSAKDSDPYNRIWIRDNSLVAISLQQAGEKKLSTEIIEGILAIVEQHHARIKAIIEQGKPYADERNVSLLHPTYKTSGEELDVEWGWRQNDAIGNMLQSAGMLGLVEEHKELIADLVKYLELVKYWEKDNGIWEWQQYAQKNTILSCVAGLRAVADYIDVPEELINKGYVEASKIDGSSNDHTDDRYGERYYDLSHLNPFMLGELAEPRIIEEIEHELLRNYGVIRYHGDHYMSGGRGREAQWVLGLLMLGHAWLACEEPEKARSYLEKADSLRVNGGDLTEAYIYKDGQYVPCEHTPLVWCHALALSLRRQLDERVYGDHPDIPVK